MVAIRPSEIGEHGYTLIELLVVIAIIGLLLTMTPALLRSALPGQRELSAARGLAQDLRSARSAALTQGVETRVVFDLTAQNYHIAPQGTVRKLPYGVRFAVTGSSSPEIDFFPDGSAQGEAILVGSRYNVRADWLTGRISVDN